MAINMRASFIGKGEDLSLLICSVLKRKVFPESNIFISKENAEAVKAAQPHEVIVCDDEIMAVIRSEIVVVCAPYKEIQTVLAPVSQCTRGKIVLVICKDQRVNIDFIQDGLASGTNVVIARLDEAQNGTRSIDFSFSKGVLRHLQEPCRNIANVMFS